MSRLSRRGASYDATSDERRAALYLRRSTNEELQADSLVYQEEILRTYAKREKFIVDESHVYRESASGRSVDGREQFMRLIGIVRSGSADFDVILVRDVSRWDRFENIDESAYYDFLCFRHGVEVHYVDEDFRRDTSPMGGLMKS
jgi:DNA invertase Pin-like site-specific DNA recombinase